MLSRINFAILVAVAAITVLIGGTVYAGTITSGTYTSDATCGIDGVNKTYTHALDMGKHLDTAVTVNGLAFTMVNDTVGGLDKDPITITGPNYYLETFPIDHNTGFNGLAGGAGTIACDSSQGMYDLLYNSLYTPHDHTNYIIELSGLTPGATYEARVYYHPWTASATRNVTLTFDEDGTGPLTESQLVNEDAGDGSADSWIGYEYIAGADGKLLMDFAQSDTNACWHQYGLTNELVQEVPEPSTLALLFAGLLGLLAYAWKKRK